MSENDPQEEMNDELETQLHLDETTPMAGRKRRNYDTAQKLEAVKYAKENSIHSAAKKFRVDRQSIKDWVKQEDELERQR